MSAGHDKPNHPYHLVDPSPWPLVGAVSGGTTAIGMVSFMHDITPWLLVAGCLMILATMFVWWRDVIKEAVHQGHHTKVVQQIGRANVCTPATNAHLVCR